MMKPMKLVLATRNRHKLEELRTLFDLPGLELSSALDHPEIPDVEEDGKTFEENAIKKAITLARATRCWALADDSGLEVDALDGAPGVHSARYAGEPVSYPANNARLLRELHGVTDRRARFRCVVALASPSGRARTVDGRCEGRIIHETRGAQGFGYDPLFVPEGFEKTFAEMESSAKHAISHRGRALQKARAAWHDFLKSNPPDWSEHTD
jgi:XTP/dITP diphosphohydrolase